MENLKKDKRLIPDNKKKIIDMHTKMVKSGSTGNIQLNYSCGNLLRINETITHKTESSKGENE